jgi:hypothetical protein
MTVTPTEFLSLTTEWYETFLQEPQECISRVVFREVTRSAHELLSSSFTTEEVANQNGRQLMCELFYLYVHLLNRTAFRLFGHEFRCEFQDRLADTCLPDFIVSLFPQGSAQESQDVLNVLLEGVNQAEILYGSKQMVVDEHNYLSDKAVVPTFAKRVSTLLGHPDNPETIVRVQTILAESLGRASLNPPCQYL